MTRLSSRAHLRLRLAVAVVLGVGAGVAAGQALGLAVGLLSAWGTVALVSVIWTLLVVWPMDAEQTRAHATDEDPGRQLARAAAILGSLASLAAVVFVASEAQHASGARAYVLAIIALASVASSWALIQVDYGLHYAHMYYQLGPTGEPAGGINFNQLDPPQYTDFAYFSVGLGMTYQVADTNVERNGVRRVVIAQTLLCYVFGVGIIANVVNLISGLG